nr:MAG TPA: hypothetical protein [Caudoviricetes sp.]
MASVDEITKAYNAQQNKAGATAPGTASPTNAATGTTPAAGPAAAAPTTPTTPTPTASASGGVGGTQTNQGLLGSGYNTARTDAINQIYDAQRKAREEELKAAYDRSMSDYQAARDKIAPEYQKQANDLSVQYERNRQNFNNQAAATGINSGTASQAALARGGEYQRDFGNLRTAEANATAEADRQMANLTAEYQSNIRAALADNDYKKAQALLDEYNNGYQRDLKNAQILAEFGDFSAFANLYGADQAKNMEAVWRAQNPELAASLDYAAGKIDAEQYRQLTGSYPAGYIPAGGLGGGGGGTRSASDIIRDQLWQMAGSGGITEDDFVSAMGAANRF